MQVSVSIALTPELWERTRKNEINRSRVCRKALEQECNRIEKEAVERGEVIVV